MKRNSLLLICSLLIFFACKNSGKLNKSIPAAIPVLTAKDATGKDHVLQIDKMLVNIVVSGNVATTTYDITYRNTTARILEGEFEFPLADGQSICSYALEIEGKLREGVVVEKQLARVAFENTVRRNIDPGLVEKTKGNNFRTRIYPIPANGYKRIVIGFEQELTVTDNRLQYQLPLALTEKLQEFSVEARVQQHKTRPVLLADLLAEFGYRQSTDDWQSTFQARNFTPSATIAFAIPFESGEGTMLTSAYENETIFHVSGPLDLSPQTTPKPGKIVLLWDVSASSAKRQQQLEINMLRQYLEKLQDVELTLVPFHINTLQPETFNINNGNTDQLLSRLNQFYADGGTQLGAIHLKDYSADEILLFTDGLSTFGKTEIALSTTPVTVINSAAAADHAYLKFIAKQTAGRYIDLTAMTAEAATESLQEQSLQYISASFDSTAIHDVYASQTARGGFAVSGRLKNVSANITLNFGYGNKITESKQFTIHKNNSVQQGINRLWANLKIATLEMQFQKHKATITALGKAFAIVTQNTSLLVLDRVEDYVEYEITPPADLQQKYFTLLKEKQANKKFEVDLAFNEALDAINSMSSWWQMTQRKITVKQQFTQPIILANSLTTNGNATYFATMDSAVTYKANVSTGAISQEPLGYSSNAGPVAVEMDRKLEDNTLQLLDSEVTSESPAASKDSIQLSAWEPDMPYLKTLEKTAAADWIKVYQSFKTTYANQPSFYIDVARFFFAHQQRQQGLLVLSNICEMKLEDAELLRIVANQLQQINELDLAIETFKTIKDIRAEQPQSYRDLALAHNDAGHYDEAVQLLHEVAIGNWDSRFGAVKAIALNEMNAIISAHPQTGTTGIDKRLIKAMPVDARIVIGWSSDNSDVDLWVTDPKKEKCFYSNSQTTSGGRISSDVTQGYGPEEFMIKKALNGNYSIEINLYGDNRQTLGGPINIKAELFTHFGKPNQKRETINFRVTSSKEVIKLGALNFKG